MKISEISKITGLSEHTLRFYEKSGLIRNVAKRAGGVRDYGPNDLNTLSMIECLKKTGMSLNDIRTFIQWCDGGDETISQRHNMFLERRAAVMAQIAELKNTLKIIDFKIKYYGDAMAAGTLAIYDNNKPKMPDFFKKSSSRSDFVRH